MTKQAVEDLGRGLLIVDADNTSVSGVSLQKPLKQQCHNPTRNSRSVSGNPGANGAIRVVEPGKRETGGEAGPRDIRLSLGTRLRQAREARGLSASDVAKVLKFKRTDVEALESGDITGFAPVYAVGYVRTYADFLGEKALGANVAEAVEQFRDEHFRPEDEVYAFPEQDNRRKLFGGSLVIGTVVMALGLYMIWQFTQGAQAARMSDDAAGPSAYQASLEGVTAR